MLIKIICVLAISSLYTIIRYIFFGTVEADQIPIFLLNKSISFSSIIFLMLAAYNYHGKYYTKSAIWGKATFHTAGIHILLSLSIFSKQYYPKFFSGDKMHFMGELAILLGVIASYCYYLTRKKRPFVQPLTVYCLASALVMGHLFAMGYRGWVNVQHWQGGLPPISLICFIIAFFSLMLYLKSSLANAKK